MKYAIIIPDGAADEPLDQLNGETPIEAARTPNMDWIASHGVQGIVRTVPQGFESGSDVATMTLLGYDPAVYHTGRAPLEAAAKFIKLSPTDWVFRCNLVTVIDGVMKDHSAGGISDDDAKLLLDRLRPQLPADFELHQGVSYRHLLVYRGAESFDVKTKPPHEIPNQRVEEFLPSGTGSQILGEVIERSRTVFADQTAATQVWLWGQGRATNLPKFVDRFVVKSAAMISGVDLLRGLARLLYWDNLNVGGMTSFHDTNYTGQGAATAAALDRFDLVFSHVEAPDEASHLADWKTKVASIEAIDEHIVGPVLKKLQTFPDWRILVMPDHPTNIATRKHGYGWPPFCIAGSDIRATKSLPYSERNAKTGGVKIERGHELMNAFLHGRWE